MYQSGVLELILGPQIWNEKKPTPSLTDSGILVPLLFSHSKCILKVSYVIAGIILNMLYFFFLNTQVNSLQTLGT